MHYSEHITHVVMPIYNMHFSEPYQNVLKASKYIVNILSNEKKNYLIHGKNCKQSVIIKISSQSASYLKYEREVDKSKTCQRLKIYMQKRRKYFD